MSNQSTAPAPSFTLYRFLAWVVTMLTPIALVLTAVRALIIPPFPAFEYSMPGFPADAYGFTLQDRLKWSSYALDYLVNDAGIEYLGDLRFSDGSAVYNDRELKHMVDVKITISKALNVWYLSMAALLALGVWAWFGKWFDDFRRGLSRGGWLTAILIVVVIVIVLLAFGWFFVAFHNVFFAAGTWMFLWSDTLIRLFPERFWRDIFIYVGAISAGLGLAIGYLVRPRKK